MESWFASFCGRCLPMPRVSPKGTPLQRFLRMTLQLIMFDVSSIRAKTESGAPVQVRLVSCGHCTGAAFFEFMTSEPEPHRHTQCAHCQRVHCTQAPNRCTVGLPQLIVSRAAQG